LIRNHARYGNPKQWPYSIRRIYSADRKIFDSEGKPLQTMFEYDILRTSFDEYYFVIALFGLELTINIGGPEIEGYKDWLENTKGISPLYFGKNSL
ncbi:MAG TPA: hypothetical protein VMW86_04750, partial [Dehalococcoidales bacterium]|nr:hypothetical protein [Dehalococcoidales bacterium]